MEIDKRTYVATALLQSVITSDEVIEVEDAIPFVVSLADSLILALDKKVNVSTKKVSQSQTTKFNKRYTKGTK